MTGENGILFIEPCGAEYIDGVTTCDIDGPHKGQKHFSRMNEKGEHQWVRWTDAGLERLLKRRAKAAARAAKAKGGNNDTSK